MNFKIDENSIGQRLDKFLADNLSTPSSVGANFSRSQIQKKIKSGEVLVNDKLVTPHYFLKEGDVVLVSSVKESSVKDNELFKNIEIISKTENYLVINKPAGLLVHPVKSTTGRGILPEAKLFDRVNPTENNNEQTLADWLVKKFPKIKSVWDHDNPDGKIRPGIVHRLDRDVCGLMVLARTQAMLNNLKEQFQARTVQKEYTALAHGNIELDEGEITRSITRSKKTGLMIARGTNSEQGKNAVTKFEVLKRYKNYTLLKVKLITGRTHQIRVHLRSIGHSVVGDTLYQTKDVRKAKNKPELDFIFLCSTLLSFQDLNNEQQEFEIELPVYLVDFLKTIK